MQISEDFLLRKEDEVWVSSSGGIETLREITNTHETKEKRDKQRFVFDFLKKGGAKYR